MGEVTDAVVPISFLILGHRELGALPALGCFCNLIGLCLVIDPWLRHEEYLGRAWLMMLGVPLLATFLLRIHSESLRKGCLNIRTYM